jgi:hypothetical protein
MQSSSFLLIFYGALFALAVAELVQTWKKLFYKPYWEYTSWSIAFFFIAAYNWYGMQYRLEALSESFFSYLFMMIPPLAFYLLVSVFTPEKEEDVKEHFFYERKSIFILLAIFVFTNILVSLFTSDRSLPIHIIRIGAVAIALLCAFINKLILRIILLFYLFAGILLATILQL